ncbi:DUF6412 domain-containing protein [Catellatospora sp. KI3]|uniref:DUF6412 domain-containing protein n=1 Tax=Catellatospora sp. KI3 TaxID=3041620 RepID=UPI002482C6D1|nr:DUF6412 domain-containing protein [Catellatospora sp. KI3]MDI1462106.1 DUF6412 domain-containing protein [Catellatospora sp. KI3]
MPIALASRWSATLWLALLCTGVVAAGTPGLTGMLASAAVLVVASVVALRALAGIDASGHGHAAFGSSLRERARRQRVPRHADPDAAGRARPRAPGLL